MTDTLATTKTETQSYNLRIRGSATVGCPVGASGTVFHTPPTVIRRCGMRLRCEAPGTRSPGSRHAAFRCVSPVRDFRNQHTLMPCLRGHLRLYLYTMRDFISPEAVTHPLPILHGFQNTRRVWNIKAFMLTKPNPERLNGFLERRCGQFIHRCALWGDKLLCLELELGQLCSGSGVTARPSRPLGLCSVAISKRGGAGVTGVYKLCITEYLGGWPKAHPFELLAVNNAGFIAVGKHV